jgi:hypothetical protein
LAAAAHISREFFAGRFVLLSSVFAAEIADNSKVRVHVGSSAAKPFYFRVPGSGGAYYLTTLHHCNCLAFLNQVIVHKTHLLCKVFTTNEQIAGKYALVELPVEAGRRTRNKQAGGCCSPFALVWLVCLIFVRSIKLRRCWRMHWAEQK